MPCLHRITFASARCFAEIFLQRNLRTLPDPTQRATFAYDGYNGIFSLGTKGRISQITYAGPHGLSVIEMYSYHSAGGIIAKRLDVTGASLGIQNFNLDASYIYDNEGHVTSVAYPSAQVNSNGTTVAGPTYNYTYDSLGRLNGMTDQANTNWVSSVSYGPADEMLQMQANSFTETRTYNSNLQLIELVSGANVHRKYNYSATQNNGQILSQQDVVSGETISYQYDSLQRLVQASATGDPSGAWSQAMTYDGFGNLTQKVSSNAPALSVAVDYTTNRIQTNAAYDANGNLTGYAGDGYSYDFQNRLLQANPASGGTVRYGYDTSNHRIYKGAYNNGTYSAEEIYFYGAEGRKYGTWRLNAASGVLVQASVTKQWFGARLVSPEDRLGSQGRYFAYGEQRPNVSPTNPGNGQEQFATYTRDSATGLDYADQRYYSSVIGRFTRPDPSGGSASAASPQSWNRYAYVGNDPVNYLDQSGTCGELAAFGQSGDTITVDVYAPCAGTGVATGGIRLQPIRMPEDWNTADPAPDGGGAAGGQITSAINLAVSALNNIANKINQNNPKCQDDLAKLAANASRTLNFQTLLAQASASASFVYDGSTSPTPWDPAKFGNTVSGNDQTPGWTVGKEFTAVPSITAVSQMNGNAIWVNSTYMATVFTAGTNPSLLGTMTHELVHKFGVSDEGALSALGYPSGTDSGLISTRLALDCFGLP